MPDRDRLHDLAVAGGIAAVILVLLVLALSFQREQDQETKGDTHSASQSARDNQLSPPPGVPHPGKNHQIKPPVYVPTCDKPKDHDEADLCQQQRMAEAAEQQACWVLIQTVVGIAGLTALFGALYYSHISSNAALETAVQAGRAAKAAEDATTETLKITKTGVRQ